MLFQGGQLFYKMIVIVRSLRRRRTDILDVGELTLDIGEQAVGETTRRRNDRNSVLLTAFGFINCATNKHNECSSAHLNAGFSSN